jgi:hypothetical protein
MHLLYDCLEGEGAAYVHSMYKQNMYWCGKHMCCVCQGQRAHVCTAAALYCSQVVVGDGLRVKQLYSIWSHLIQAAMGCCKMQPVLPFFQVTWSPLQVQQYYAKGASVLRL